MKPQLRASTALPRPPVALFTALFLAFSVPAWSQAPARVPLIPVISGATAVAGPDGFTPAVEFELELSGVTALRKAGRGRMTLPIPGRAPVELELQPFHVLASDAELVSTSDSGTTPYSTDLRVFRGVEGGDSETWAILGLTGNRMLGSIHTKDGIWTILTPELSPEKNGRHLIWDEATAVRNRAVPCGVGDDPANLPDPLELARRAEAQRPGSQQGASADRLICRMALDTDYELYAGTFGSDLAGATNYLLTMMATVSAMYERDINVTLEVGYLHIYTTVNDPYDQADPGAQLNQFRTYWNANHGSIVRDDAFLFSGRSYGGVAGIAYLNVLCTPSSYALGSITQVNESFPTNQVVFNAILTAHEIGHNFGSPHTHSCYWQSNGFAPVGALLDTCAAAEGSCNMSASKPAYGKGTIMSYCQLQGPVTQTLRSDFHPACITLMRQVAEASCLPVATVQPPTALSIVDNAGTQTLTWTASTTSGVVGYDVYASVFPLDHDPPLLGSTAGTSFSPLPTGTFYFKVKAVRASDESPFSDEARGSSCSFGEISSNADQPRGLATEDFNEDGIADLAVVRGTSGVVSIFLGQGTGGVGNGTFTLAASYDGGPNPKAVATADFNEDGITDLAVVSFNSTINAEGTLRILYGSGSGGVGNGAFTVGPVYATFSNPTHLLAADFNEDGIVDIAVAGSFPGRVGVFPGLGANGVGNGTFGARTNYLFLANPPNGLAAGDFNEDGILDLMVAHRGPGSDTEARGVLLVGQGSGGKGNGLFQEFVIYAQIAIRTTSINDLRTGDFNGDGHLDVAVATDTITAAGAVPRISVSLGQGDGYFLTGRGFQVGGSTIQSMDVADMDQNGTADAVMTSNEVGEPSSMAVLYGNGDGTLGAPLRFGTGSNEGKRVLTGDFDEDGVPDATASLATRVVVFRGLCTGAPPADIDVVTPDGGEGFVTGSEALMSWTKGSAVLTVDLEISRDDGVNWETIATDLVGTEFTWTVTPPTTTNARFRVLDSTLRERRDMSTGRFYIGPVTAAPEPVTRITRFAVSPLSANPSRSGALFRVDVPESGPVRMLVVDVQGRTLHEETRMVTGPGTAEMAWSGLGAGGSTAPAGVYYVRLSFGDRSETRAVTILR